MMVTLDLFFLETRFNQLFHTCKLSYFYFPNRVRQEAFENLIEFQCVNLLTSDQKLPLRSPASQTPLPPPNTLTHKHRTQIHTYPYTQTRKNKHKHTPYYISGLVFANPLFAVPFSAISGFVDKKQTRKDQVLWRWQWWWAGS